MRRNEDASAALERLNRIQLAHLPTPLERLERLSAALRRGQIWVKRDDCTGLAMGGNKTRKVEYLMAAALAEKADTIVTAGAIQSNHARQVAAASARLGLKCVLILMDAVPGRSPVYRALGNVLIDRFCGAEIEFVPPAEDSNALLESAAAKLIQQGRKPYLIPVGGSNELGAAAYASAFFELLEQLNQIRQTIDAIVVPTVSGGTMAGVLLGQFLADWHGRIIGIAAGDQQERAIERVRQPLLAAARLLGISEAEIGGVTIEIKDRYVGAGYGIPSKESVEAIQLLARCEGLLLDPVYTGKAMAGLIGLVRENGFAANEQNILFWLTGGSVALHAYPELLTSQGD